MFNINFVKNKVIHVLSRFIANSVPLKWPDDWSSKLHAEALAFEPWKGPEWIDKM